MRVSMRGVVPPGWPATGRFCKREMLSEWIALQGAFVWGTRSGAVGEKGPRRPSADLAALSTQIVGVCPRRMMMGLCLRCGT